MGNEVDYLYEPQGSELHWEGLKKAPEHGSVQQASFSGSGSVGHTGVHPADRSGMQGTMAAHSSEYSAPPPPVQHQERQLTPEELMVQARQMLDTQAAGTQAQINNGASTGDRDANGGRLPEWLTRTQEQ